MSVSYIVTGPLPVNGKHAGDVVMRNELTDPDFLLAIGYITPASKKAKNDRTDLVESQEESDMDSTSDAKQEIL